MPDTIINWVAVRAMPEFMTNLRVACLKLRGGVGNSTLLNPDLFRKEAVRRGISVFESDSNCNEVPEDQISKGDDGEVNVEVVLGTQADQAADEE